MHAFIDVTPSLWIVKSKFLEKRVQNVLNRMKRLGKDFLSLSLSLSIYMYWGEREKERMKKTIVCEKERFLFTILIMYISTCTRRQQ